MRAQSHRETRSMETYILLVLAMLAALLANSYFGVSHLLG